MTASTWNTRDRTVDVVAEVQGYAVLVGWVVISHENVENAKKQQMQNRRKGNNASCSDQHVRVAVPLLTIKSLVADHICFSHCINCKLVRSFLIFLIHTCILNNRQKHTATQVHGSHYIQTAAKHKRYHAFRMCQTEDYKMACGHWHDPERMRNTTMLCGNGCSKPDPNPNLPRHSLKCEECVAKDKDKEKLALARKEAGESGCCVIL
jgi:hypothetical protein